MTSSSSLSTSAKQAGFISLGCHKNLVDTETYIGILVEQGYEVTNALEQADLIVVNTCTFIKEAREETETVIEDMIRWKQEDARRILIIAGCHVQRFKKKILTRWPDINGIIGISDIPRFRQFLEEVESSPGPVSFTRARFSSTYQTFPRLLTSVSGSSFLKIAEGCDNHCSYCVIPSIRGPFRSRSIEALIQEAASLAEIGIRELSLIAQDTGAYGKDFSDHSTLPDLVQAMSRIDGLDWIRLLYIYPETLTDAIINIMAREPKVVHYIDFPMQHVSNTILKKMNRRGDRAMLLERIQALREAIPDIVIRSTFISGFPGETAEDHQQLLDFIAEAKLDYVGFFGYSREAGTPAAKMKNKVRATVIQRRLNELMDVQSQIMQQKLSDRIGEKLTVLIETPDTGRYYGQAPDIDGVVQLNQFAEIGTFEDVLIKDIDGIDLQGDLLS